MTESMRMQRSSRDPEQTRQHLEAWLASTLGPGSAPTVSELAGTEANGMSSDTVLFRARWHADGEEHDERLVARVAPDAADVPVFATYDLQAQYDVIRRVGEVTAAPVPRTWWCEGSPDPLGAPFFVMSQVDGLVPPDVMPYTFGDNWLFDATPAQQHTLQTTTVAAIAELHDVGDPLSQFGFLERATSGGTHLQRHFTHTRDWYAMVKQDGVSSDLVERAFGWLEENWPSFESDPVLSWGDARIGNVLYDDFRPAALLDWEMAGLGPPELDIAWLVYAHHVFQSMARLLELPGMPVFLTPPDVASQYESLRGYAVRDLRWYMLYSAVQWGIVFLRTGHRQAHFGEREMPADPNELIHNRLHLDSLLAELGDI